MDRDKGVDSNEPSKVENDDDDVDIFGDEDFDEAILEAVEKVEEDECPDPPSQEHLACLKTYFGHASFKDLQWKTIRALIYKKQDQITVMATGYGKSLIYQVYAILSRNG